MRLSNKYFVKLLCANILLVTPLRADLSDDIEEDKKETPIAEENQTQTTEKPKEVEKKVIKEQPKPQDTSSKKEVVPEPIVPSKEPSTKIDKQPSKSEDKATKKSFKSGKDNTDKKVTFSTEGLRGEKSKGIVELRKNVVINQGDLKLNADTAILHFNPVNNEVEKVIAEGNVKLFKGPSEDSESVKARGNRIIFLVKEQTVTVYENARLWRGNDLVKGSQITYELKTGWVNAEKVEGVVEPGENNGKK